MTDWHESLKIGWAFTRLCHSWNFATPQLREAFLFPLFLSIYVTYPEYIFLLYFTGWSTVRSLADQMQECLITFSSFSRARAKIAALCRKARRFSYQPVMFLPLDVWCTYASVQTWDVCTVEAQETAQDDVMCHHKVRCSSMNSTFWATIPRIFSSLHFSSACTHLAHEILVGIYIRWV